MSDEQAGAESLDEDITGIDDPVTTEEVEVDFPPDRPMGIPFADADVTDESFAERSLQEEPEVWERQVQRTDLSGAADEQLEQIIDTSTDDER